MFVGSWLGQGLARQQQEQKQQSDNTPNWATTYGKFRTTGFGVMVPETDLTFDATFEDEPFFTWGARLYPPPPASIAGSVFDPLALESNGFASVPATGALPMLSAAVYGFTRDASGHYVAAKLYFRVDFGATDSQALLYLSTVSVDWTLSFAGQSFKKVPDAEAAARIDSRNSLATAFDVT